MITVQAATDIVLQNTYDFGAESIPLEQAIGRILAENLSADRDFPPFDRVTMDGIAIHFDTFVAGQRDFKIEGLQAAGAPQLTLEKTTHCLEVMTGAMLPQGTETVVRYEDLDIVEGIATIKIAEIEAGQNIHKRGSDRRQGDLLVPSNRLISPAEIGVAATVGKAHLQVKKLPRVIIISTGDEIVDVTETPLAHQIRSSNAHTIQSLLTRWRIQATRLHLPDDRDATVEGLRQALKNFDVLILSGGVSMGKLDYVPEALSTLGVEKLFHKVQQRPGKPFWFGKTSAGTTVFALPGNPVSSFMCAVRYVEPWLCKSLGLPIVPQFAIINETIIFKPNLTYFLQVQLSTDETGRMLASPLEGGGSGDLANLTEADGFLELPQGQEVYEIGEVFRFWNYRW